MKKREYGFLFIACLQVACAPEFDSRPSELRDARILAVQAEPAEVRPSEELSYRFLLADPENRFSVDEAKWAFCTSPKPLSEENIVSSACFEDGVEAISGAGNPISTRMPSTSCIRFGPELVESDARPRDADSTGGYFQPLRLSLLERFTVGLSRVRCNLAGAPSSIAADFEARYTNNQNPGEPTLLLQNESLSFEDIAVEDEVIFLLRWTEEDIETFPIFEVENRELRDEQETLSVSWFATGGSFQTDTSTAPEGEVETTNLWKAPQEAGSYTIYAVLRDSRGGVSWASQELNVQ